MFYLYWDEVQYIKLEIVENLFVTIFDALKLVQNILICIKANPFILLVIELLLVYGNL